MSVASCCPHKVILSGEHAVLYGHPCISCAIDVWAFCRVRHARGSGEVSQKPTGEHVAHLLSGAALHTYAAKNTARGATKEEMFRVAQAGVRQSSPFAPALVDAYRAMMMTFAQNGGAYSRTLGCITSLELWEPAEMLGAGCGSSASLCVCLASLLYDMLGREDPHAHKETDRNTLVFNLAQVGETSVHGRASGIDAFTVINGGVCVAVAPDDVSTGAERNLAFSRSGCRLPASTYIVLKSSGLPKSTRAAVQRVRDRCTDGDGLELVGKIGSCTSKLVALMGASAPDDAAFHEHIRENQLLLAGLGLSCAEIDRALTALMSSGCRSAKITGAGCGGMCLGFTNSGSDSALSISYAGASVF